MTAKLKTLKDYYVSALQAINGTGGYVNTIATINQRTVNKLAEVSRGAAEVWVEIDRKSLVDFTRTTRVKKAFIKITAQIQNPLDAANNDAAIFSLDGDIEKAIGADLKCGGAALDAHPVGTEFTYGEPSVQCVVTVEVRYAEAVTP